MPTSFVMMWCTSSVIWAKQILRHASFLLHIVSISWNHAPACLSVYVRYAYEPKNTSLSFCNSEKLMHLMSVTWFEFHLTNFGWTYRHKYLLFLWTIRQLIYTVIFSVLHGNWDCVCTTHAVVLIRCGSLSMLLYHYYITIVCCHISCRHTSQVSSQDLWYFSLYHSAMSINCPS